MMDGIFFISTACLVDTIVVEEPEKFFSDLIRRLRQASFLGA